LKGNVRAFPFFYCPIKTTAEGGGKEQMRS
jgi:hypothetical protein